MSVPGPSDAVAARRRVHVGIAEQGKLLALAGDHGGALTHYREAMLRARQAGEPEVFGRHYLECAVESLELMGAFAEVVALCDQQLAHYAAHPPKGPLARRDVAHIHQRRGAVLLKLGRGGEARPALAEAIELAPDATPLAAVLIRWIDSRLHVDPARITAEQRRLGLFSVRTETVDATRARPLPGAPGMAASPDRG